MRTRHAVFNTRGFSHRGLCPQPRRATLELNKNARLKLSHGGEPFPVFSAELLGGKAWTRLARR